MRNPALAVASTIPQRLFSGLRPALGPLAFLMMGVNPLLNSQSHGQHFNYGAISGFALFAGVVAFHAKQVVLDTKGRLLPGAPRIPLAVAGIMLLIYLAAMPLLVHAVGPAPLLPLTAVIWLVTASALHFVVRSSWLSAVLPLLFFFTALKGDSALQMRVTAAVETPPIAWSLIAFSSAWMMYAGRLLSRMTEESPGYQPIGLRQARWNRSLGSTGEVNQVWRDPTRARWLAFAAPAEHRLQRATHRGASDNLWTRCRRWRSVNQRPYAIAVMVLLISAPNLWMTRNSPRLPGGLPQLSLMPLLTLFALIGAFTGLIYAQQWQIRSTDILKPGRREDFFREMGLCVAIDMARNVLGAAVLLAVLTALVAPASLPPLCSRHMLLAVIMASGGMVFSLGSVVWFLRLRLPVVVGMCTPIAQLPLFMMSATTASLPTALLVAAGFAVIGLGLTYDAYRRWLVTDLG